MAVALRAGELFLLLYGFPRRQRGGSELGRGDHVHERFRSRGRSRRPHRPIGRAAARPRAPFPDRRRDAGRLAELQQSGAGPLRLDHQGIPSRRHRSAPGRRPRGAGLFLQLGGVACVLPQRRPGSPGFGGVDPRHRISLGSQEGGPAMTNITLWRFPMLALAVVSLSGCFDDSSYVPFVGSVADRNSFAIINGPRTVDIGSTSVEVTGAFFPPDSVVYWNGKPQATTFKGPGALEFTPDPGLTDDSGTARVSIATAGGLSSNTATAVVEQNSVSVTSVSPTSANPGDGPLTLTVDGVGFVTGAQVLWNGAPLSTTRVNGHQLTAAIPAALLANGGNALVRVEVPCCARSPFFPFRTVVTFNVGPSKNVTVTDAFRSQVSTLDLAADSTSVNI